MIGERDLDIARNVKTIAWLQAEILGAVSSVYRLMAQGAQRDDELVEMDLANAIIGCYLLGKRLGIGFPALDDRIDYCIQENSDKKHEVEKWYGDFTALQTHRKMRRKP